MPVPGVEFVIVLTEMNTSRVNPEEVKVAR
jgi:hypothetical protein